MSVTANQANGNSNTTSTFLTALVTNASLLAIQVGAFLILKARLGRIYSPRTYLPPVDKRAQELPRGPWRWIPALIQSPPEDVIHKNGLDAYMFLRFLKLLLKIFLVFTIFTSIILFPVDAVGVHSPRTGLDRITWSNITSPLDARRFSAHIILVYLLTFFVIFMIRREMFHFIHLRHKFLISKSHSHLAQARTVLITSVPDELSNEHDLRRFSSFVPGGVDKVWIYRDTKDLNQLFGARQKACNKLEAAESKVLRMATAAWRIKTTAHEKAMKVKLKDEEKSDTQPEDALDPPPPSLEFLDELVPQEKRPKTRTGFLGLLGTRVDTVDWYKGEISRLNVQIKEARKHIVKGKFLGSAFIRCNLQMGAHVLAQCISYHEPMLMYDKWIEANPRDIVWRNLDDGAFEMRTRYVISWVATVGLIIAWAFPVAFVGTLSNVESLCQKVSWLAWVCRAHKPIPGLIQGVLPPLLFIILFALLPFILRGLAWYECIPRYSLISISVYRRYFFFLLIHGFLIVTVTSGITAAIQGIIEQPTRTVQQLASQLPGASVFFLTYMVAQGLSGAGSALIQLIPLISHFIRKWFLGRTPRQAYGVTFLMPSADFGVILPQLSLLATIGFAYSIISPLINVLALISFVMFYIAWKFLLTQVFDQPEQRETGGLYFPMAVSNLFIGLYIEHICLACLFFLKTSVSRASSVVEGCFMLALLIITFLAQMFIKRSFNPITEYLPMSLATKKMAKRYERKRARQSELPGMQVVKQVEEEIDMFSRDRIMSMRRRIKATAEKIDSTIGGVKAKVIPRTQRDAIKDDGDEEGVEDIQINPIEERDEPILAETTSQPPEDAPDVSRQVSIRSRASNVSKKSKAFSKSHHSSHPVFDEPASARGSHSEEGDSEDSVDEDDFDEHAFDHPSTYKEQPWIWVPRDTLGLSQVIVDELKGLGVDASDVGAVMDGRGVVEVNRNPPDEEWTGE